MKFRSIHAYVLLICSAALVGLVAQDWSTLAAFSAASFVGLAALFVLALLSESLALPVTIARSAGNSSIAFIPILASQLLFGTAATTLLVVLESAIVEFLIRKKTYLRAAFNTSQLTVAAAVGGITYTAIGGMALVQPSASASVSILHQLIPFAVFCIAFLGFNHLAVTVAIAVDQHIPFRRVWKTRAGRSGANMFYDLLISPIAIAVAFVYIELGLLGILITLLPLLFIRHAYLTTYKLQEANRDLLAALVKAIETRDPYTSGHSLRVSSLARRIAEEMSLSRQATEDIETAALLHDIGKIEAIYTDILMKPHNLTPEERRIIQSHVTKGVELLESLSSFNKDIIRAVRHHHERVDGRGYPDGLSGDAIPLGARIIKICDAVDAMLSDRPYRKALTLRTVREQLIEYSSVQFDEEIVATVVETDLLEKHYADVQISKTSEKRKAPYEDFFPGRPPAQVHPAT